MTISIYDNETETTIEFAPMSRDEYLAERAEWRKNYADLSARIRQKKIDLKTAQRAQTNPGALQMTLNILADYARAAMEERRIMKLKAAASYEHMKKEMPIAA
jgi:hypothetical protein